MDRVRAMRVFVEVVKQHGFSAAANELNMTTSAVSRIVGELEQWLGLKLLQRSTRKISLTTSGEAYLPRFVRMVDELDQLHASALDQQQTLSGTLKVSAPMFIGHLVISQLLPEFLHAYPQVNLDIQLTDRPVDLLGEGYDLALRLGELNGDDFIARRVGTYCHSLVASPQYIKQHGTPESLDALSEHNCIINRSAGYFNQWHFTREQKRLTHKAEGNLIVSGGQAVMALVKAGVGVGYLPAYYLTESLADNSLISLLDDHCTPEQPVSLIYPPNRYQTCLAREFVQFITDNIERLGLTCPKKAGQLNCQEPG